ncbi:MAG TPA: DinB family protein [Phototrophicaceae bacterium]|nr:DinB family protein [Phototrophicaceae bacterium]
MEPFFADYLERMNYLSREFIATLSDLPADSLDWVPGADMNSFCVLVVHTTAAARFWIGDVVFDEPSNRVRADEFKARGLSTDEMKARFAALDTYVSKGLERISFADLAAVKPFRHPNTEVVGVTAGWALLHALQHTALHLGHAQITRQLWQQRQ